MKTLTTQTYDGQQIADEAISDNSVAVSLWKEKRFGEARSVVQKALRHAEGLYRLRLTLTLSVIERADGDNEQAFQVLKSESPAFENCEDEFIKGKYYHGLAVTLYNLGRLDDSLIQYEGAALHYNNSGQEQHYAGTLNNIGNTYIELGKPTEALPYLDRARSYFDARRDTLTVAQIDDTRAKAYLALGDIDKSLSLARWSIKALHECGDEGLAFLADSETTYFQAKVARLKVRYAEHEQLAEHHTREARSNEKEMVRLALEKAEGRISKAAHLLGESHAWMDYKLKQYPDLVALRKPKGKQRGRTKAIL